MANWSWRTLLDSSVEVDRHDGAGFVRPTCIEHPEVLRTQQRCLDWAALAADKAAKYDVPLSWILAVVYAESGGKADAENACCVGLMAIHCVAHNKSRAEMHDPEKNLDYGTSLLAESRSRGYDLPATASIHVAGGGVEYKPHSGTCCSAKCKPGCDPDKCSEHPDHPEGSPWGYCEHMFRKTQGDGAVGYIDRVVPANNSLLDLLWGRVEPGDPWVAASSKQAAVEPLGARLAAFAGAAALGYLAIDELSRRLRAR